MGTYKTALGLEVKNTGNTIALISDNGLNVMTQANGVEITYTFLGDLFIFSINKDSHFFCTPDDVNGVIEALGVKCIKT